MVDNVGNHSQNQVAGWGGTQALERYADGNRHDVAAAETGDNTADSAHQHKHAANQTLAELVGQRHNKDRGDGHRDSTHDAEQTLRSAPCVCRAKEGVIQHPLAEVAHRAVLHSAAPLEQHIERHDNPPHTVAGNNLELLRQADRLFGGVGFLGAAFLGDTLAGEHKLQINREGTENTHGQHGNEPEVLVLLQGEGDKHREHHRANAHIGQTCHVGEGSQRAALLAVTGGNRNHRGVGGVVDGVGHCIIEVVCNGNPDHLGRALKRHDEHQYAGDRKGQCREQNPRAGLAGQCLGALNQLADNQVGRHNEHGGNQLQGGQEAQIELENIGKVVLQDAGKDTAGKQCAEGADKVAQQHFRQLDVIALDAGACQRAFPEVAFGFRHNKGSLLLLFWGFIIIR